MTVCNDTVIVRSMKKFNGVLAAGLAAAALLACQREDPATKERLDKIVAKLDGIEKKLDTVGARGGMPMQPQGPRPGMPDPTAVYSVPIDGDPAWGPATAKVTVVEAFDYA